MLTAESGFLKTCPLSFFSASDVILIKVITKLMVVIYNVLEK